MAYSTIPKGNLYMNPVMYTGTGSTRSVTGVGFQPDWTWVKGRSTAYSHNIYDSVRGVTKIIKSNSDGVEDTQSTSLTAFDTDGFTLGSYDESNYNSRTYASWNWKAGGGQGSSNTAGSINTTYTSVNTTSGFSISKYTGTGSAGATVGHGLGVAPKMIIVKGLTYADVWIVGGDNLGGWNKEMYLNSTSAVATNNNAFNGVAPTSSVFTLGSGNGTNKSGDTYIAYAFAQKQGYSKFESYTGNGNADGTFVYTGFKPAFVMVKESSSTGSWCIFDNKRLGYNPKNPRLYPNNSNAEDASETIFDIVSNGFKIRGDQSDTNASGQTYIYMAFAEAPLVGSNNVPCTAR